MALPEGDGLLLEAEPLGAEREADGEGVAASDAELRTALPDVVMTDAVEADASDGRAAVALDATRLDEEARSLTDVWIRISWHCAPMYSS